MTLRELAHESNVWGQLGGQQEQSPPEMAPVTYWSQREAQRDSLSTLLKFTCMLHSLESLSFLVAY